MDVGGGSFCVSCTTWACAGTRFSTVKSDLTVGFLGSMCGSRASISSRSALWPVMVLSFVVVFLIHSGYGVLVALHHCHITAAGILYWRTLIGHTLPPTSRSGRRSISPAISIESRVFGDITGAGLPAPISSNT